MYCPNCGTELEDGVRFCKVCGAQTEEQPVTVPLQPEEAADFAQQPGYVDGGAPTPRKNKKKKPLRTVLIAAAGVVLLGVIGVNAVNGNLSNAFAKITKSDAGYVQWICKNNKDALLDAVYDNSTKKDAKGRYEFELTDDGKDKLYRLGADRDEIEWLDTAAADITVNYDEENELVEIAVLASLNGEEIGEGSLIADDQSGDLLYITSSDYLKQALRIESGAGNQDTAFYTAASNSLLKSERSKKLLSDYCDTAIENIEKVKKRKTSISASGVSQKCTKYSVEIDYDLAIQCAETLLEKAQDDEDLKAFLSDWLGELEERAPRDYGFDADELLDEFYDVLDELQEELDEVTEEDFDYEISYDLYVDSHGKVIGRNLSITEFYGSERREGFEIRLFTAKDGSEFGIECEAEEIDYWNDGKTDLLFSIEGDGTVRGGSYSGELTFADDREAYFTLELEDINALKLVQKKLSGKITLIPEEGMDLGDDFRSVVFSAQLDGSFDDAKIVLAAEEKSDVLATLTIEAQTKNNKAEVDIPSHAADIGDFDEDMLYLDELIDRLEDAGVPEELL